MTGFLYKKSGKGNSIISNKVRLYELLDTSESIIALKVVRASSDVVRYRKLVIV